MAAVVHSAQYQQHRDGLLPAHVPVPELKIPVGKPAQGEQQFLTPRSLAAAERAVAEQEQLAAEAGSAAQRAFAEAEAAAATPRAASAAEAARIAAGKAAVTERSVAASSGIFELVVHRGWSKYVVERYATESDARTVAATLWPSWVLYHEQRGSRVELAYGGIGFAHRGIRNHMISTSKHGMNMMYGRMGSS